MSDDLRISAEELRRRMQVGEEFTVVDVRNPHAWADARDMAAGAVRLTVDDFDRELPNIPRDKPIVAYCT